MGEAKSIRSKLVDARSFDDWIASNAERVEAEIIGEQEDDVIRFFCPV